jgi:site-specific recombinase XerC
MTADPPAATAGATPPARHPARGAAAGPETLRLYDADWGTFATWCGDHGLAPLPAVPATVAAFLSSAADTLSAGALGRRAAAIAARHRQAGLATPTADPVVTDILHATRRGSVPRRPPAARPAALIRMAIRCPRDPAGLRDRALLLLAACGLGRAALVGLDVEHIHFTAAAAELTLCSAVAGAGPAGPFVVHRGVDPARCPVSALQEWLTSSKTQFGPVFRKVDRWGEIEQFRLGTDAIRRILARRSPTPRRSRRRHKAAA